MKGDGAVKALYYGDGLIILMSQMPVFCAEVCV